MEQNIEKAAEEYSKTFAWQVSGEGLENIITDFKAGAEWQKKLQEDDAEDIYDSVYMEVVEFVEKDNAACEFYKDTANNLKSKYIIIKR